LSDQAMQRTRRWQLSRESLIRDILEYEEDTAQGRQGVFAGRFCTVQS